MSDEARTDFEIGLWHNYDLLQAFDLLSLYVCTADLAPAPGAPVARLTDVLGEIEVPPGPRVIGSVPERPSGARLELVLTPTGEGAIAVDPYPFDQDSVELALSARSIPDRAYESQDAVRAALEQADQESLRVRFPRPIEGLAEDLPLRPPTLAEVALRELRRELLTGRFRAGEAISLSDAASRFGMSPLPIREALRVLVADGRVDYSPHRGYRVRAYTFTEVEEIFLMCSLLEAEALRRGIPRMDSADVAQMRELLATFNRLVRQGAMWDAVAVHRDFHFAPIECASLSRLELELRRLWDHTDHYRGLYFFPDGSMSPIMDQDHEDLLEACAAGDAERAVVLMDQHRAHALRRLAPRSAGGDGARPGRRG
jgi:DNA-binding GntR family transcriptional regulator